MGNRKRKKGLWKVGIAMLLSAVLALYAPMAYLPAGLVVYAAEEQADENGFIIEDGVLKGYIGTATEVVIPKGVTSIGGRAFSGCSSLTSISIPSSVTSIGESAFSGCSSLTSISIPEGVTSIKDWTFADCSSLTSISIPEGVTSIAFGAFTGCSSLTSISIPEGVTSIGYYAFTGCSSLTSISIPSSVTSIWGSAFTDCSSLISIVVEEGNTSYDSRDNCNAIIESSSNTLIVGCENTVIPSGVTSIEYEAFSGRSGLTSISIPEGVTSIGHSAFYGCSSLTRITIPSSVTSIEYSVFTDCSSLTSIVVEEGNTIYDSRDNCNALIESSSNRLIAGCENTVIPSSVDSIEYKAFSGRSGLTSITIPSSVTSIGEGAFAGCCSLISIVVEEGNTSYDSRGNCNAIIESSSNRLIAGCKNTVIPEGVTSIEDYAFYGCSSLTSISIPEGVTHIEEGAFASCSSLAGISIPSSVIAILYNAFENCDKLTIYGEEGSEAQTYAKENNIPFRLIGSQDIFTAEKLEGLTEENKTQDTVIETPDGLTFTFKKGTMELVDGVDVYDFGAKITEDYASLPNPAFTEDEFAFRIDYNYEGKLPGEAEVTIPAGSKWAGKKLYYYEIKEDGTYSYMCRSAVKADGSYTVKQSHCSAYVATTKVPENLGDCDGDGKPTSKDALAILKYVAGTPQANFYPELADCDGQDGITANDALDILKYIVGATKFK